MLVEMSDGGRYKEMQDTRSLTLGLNALRRNNPKDPTAMQDWETSKKSGMDILKVANLFRWVAIHVAYCTASSIFCGNPSKAGESLVRFEFRIT